MDADYGARYRDLYQRHWWWRARETMVLRLLESYSPVGGYGDILDIGCGDGLLLEHLEAFGEPQGLEADADLVTDAGRALGKITVAPFDTDFQPPERFGLILMLDVLEHLDDDVAALRHAVELLVPGGLLVLTVPALMALWTNHDDMNHHRTRYTRTTLGAAAASAGVTIDHQRYFFHWLVPLKLAIRLNERLRPRPPQVPAVPAAPINRLILAASHFEQATWGRLPWPAGSSLLAVIRRLRPQE